MPAVQEIVPRYEFRVFAQNFGLVEDKLRHLARFERYRESVEFYLLSRAGGGDNTKIRDEKLDIKTLLRVELPLALPVIMAGLRTALVLLVGTGAFATFIDAGGLGLLIQTGIVLFRFPLLVSGAILVAALALMIEWIGRLVETLATPRGLA